MRVERRPYDFDIDAEFPNARLFSRRGKAAGRSRPNAAEKYFIISDGRTMAEFLDMLDLATRERLDGLVSVIEFEDEAERDAYVAREMAFGTNLEARAE
jgi:hypothetical protein